MRFCSKCLIPDSRPAVTFDDEGVCYACRSFAKRGEIDWDTRKQDFIALVEKVKNHPGPYNCMVPVSGGKDSTWQIVTCLEYGLKPLAFTQKVPLRTELGQRNLDNLVSLGVDHIDYQVDPRVESRFVRKAFFKYGAAGLPMHMAMYRMSLNVAYRFDIPLVVWGENSAIEYGSADSEISSFKMDSKWLKKYGVSHGTEPEDWISDDLSRRDLAPYLVPSDAEIDAKGMIVTFMAHFFPWSSRQSFEISSKHGFMNRPEGPKVGYYDFADLDDDIITVHHYLKYFKFGFTRAFDQLSLDIRNGILTRDEAIGKLRALGSQTPYEDIRNFCRFINITETEFFEVAEKYRNTAIWRKDGSIWKIDDYSVPDWDWAACQR